MAVVASTGVCMAVEMGGDGGMTVFREAAGQASGQASGQREKNREGEGGEEERCGGVTFLARSSAFFISRIAFVHVTFILHD